MTWEEPCVTQEAPSGRQASVSRASSRSRARCSRRRVASLMVWALQRMTNALNRRATAARRQVLGDNLGDD